MKLAHGIACIPSTPTLPPALAILLTYTHPHRVTDIAGEFVAPQGLEEVYSQSTFVDLVYIHADGMKDYVV